jgi:hypothetical protein
MIEGLEILKQHEIMNSSIILTLIEVFIGFGIMLIAAFTKLFKKKVKWTLIFFLITITFEVFLIKYEFIPTGRNEYTVKVSKEASALELYENYEIINQDNDIWIIKDK